MSPEGGRSSGAIPMQPIWALRSEKRECRVKGGGFRGRSIGEEIGGPRPSSGSGHCGLGQASLSDPTDDFLYPSL